MTQQATVKRLLTHNMAEVEVTRRSACGHDCKKCGGCGGMETQLITVTARNTAGAQPGDQVSIEGETRQVLGLAALVYALPIVLFFIGYALGASMRLGEGTAALIGGVLFDLIGGKPFYCMIACVFAVSIVVFAVSFTFKNKNDTAAAAET